LVEKFGSEQLLVTESHYPYTGYTETCKKDVSKNLKTTYGVKNYKFIGGVYGKTNERKIMDEIYNNGPVVMNFEP
jgi:cathepsin C